MLLHRQCGVIVPGAIADFGQKRSLQMSQHRLKSGAHVGRRQFLATSTGAPALSVLSTLSSAQEPKAATGKTQPDTKWGVPGPYPGQVVEARNSRMIKQGIKNRTAIHEAVAQGMKELIGA